MPAVAVEVRPSSVAELSEVAPALMAEHWRETEAVQHEWPLKVHWLRYMGLEATGSLKCLLALLDEQPVGYAVLMVAPCLKSMDKVLAIVDAFFVTDKARRCGIGALLAADARAIARKNGAVRMQWHAKPGSRMDLILRGASRLTLTDHIYAEEL